MYTIARNEISAPRAIQDTLICALDYVLHTKMYDQIFDTSSEFFYLETGLETMTSPRILIRLAFC